MAVWRFVIETDFDGLVKSRFWDGKEKSSRSRRANPEECSVLIRT